jgi:pyrroline-5-carboxylate reductase
MRIGLIGAGNMASALARGLGEPVLVSDVVPERADSLAAELGGRTAASNAELAEASDVVVLCHKPPQLEEVAAEVAGKARAVVSILAATPLAALEAAYPGIPVYRFIPNLPAEVGRGVLCYAPGSLASQGPEQEVLELLGRAGTVIALDEPLIEPAMALMSCGPAFLALVAESLAGAGERHGLSGEDATRMVVETMAGTAAWLDAHELDGKDLRERVATPGGVTERGLATLEERGLPAALEAAVDTVVEATRR